MKRLIIWLANVFNVDLVRVEKEYVTEVKYLTNGEIQGDVFIEGNLLINGELKVNGGITCYHKED